MFWDGERWLPDDGRLPAQPRKRSDHHLRNRVSVAVIAMALVGLLLPIAGIAGVNDVAASTGSARSLLTTWSADSKVAVYQESSSRISYRGNWATVRHPDYLGDKARAAKTSKAKATLKFKGAAVSWVGPVGPTRGKAKVYIDGKLVKTVNTWASHFRPARVLFQKSWKAVGTHRISIVTVGTRGHPTVAIDAFLVAPRHQRNERGCGGLPIPKGRSKAQGRRDARARRRPDARAHRRPDARAHRRPDARAHRRPDARAHRRPDARAHRRPDARAAPPPRRPRPPPPRRPRPPPPRRPRPPPPRRPRPPPPRRPRPPPPRRPRPPPPRRPRPPPPRRPRLRGRRSA